VSASACADAALNSAINDASRSCNAWRDWIAKLSAQLGTSFWLPAALLIVSRLLCISLVTPRAVRSFARVIRKQMEGRHAIAP
jgi:hypothetical protein